MRPPLLDSLPRESGTTGRVRMKRTTGSTARPSRLRTTPYQVAAMALSICFVASIHTNGALFLRSVAWREVSWVASEAAAALPESESRAIRYRSKSSKVHTCYIGSEHVSIPVTAPSFIIIGAQKGGTTSLFRYLIRHPNVLPPKKWSEDGAEEAHFFDWRIPTDERENFNSSEEFFCHARRVYARDYFHVDRMLDAIENGTNLVSFEKTPGYMQDFALVPDYIKRTCPWLTKLVAVVRNPVDRAYSHYNMDRQVRGMRSDPLDFERNVLVEMEAMSDAGLVEWDPKSDALVPSALSAEDEARSFYKLPRKPQYLRRGLYELQLRGWSKYFYIPSELLVINYDDLSMDGARSVFKRVLEHVELPDYDLPEGYGIYQSRSYDVPMLNRTREMLEKFYRPFNDRLVRLVGQSWKDCWKRPPF